MMLSNISTRMIIAICVLATVAIAGSVVFYSVTDNYVVDFVPFAVGVILGATLNILKVIMIRRIVNKATDVEKPISPLHVQGQFFLRFILTIAVLALAAIFNFINVFGVVAGLFTMPIARYAMSFLGGKETPPQHIANEDIIDEKVDEKNE